MLRVLDRQAGYRWFPQIAIMDFELAIIEAFRTIWIRIKISGCGFHFMQAISCYLRSN
jgi:hypothetical protein